MFAMQAKIHNVIVVRFSLRVRAWRRRIFFDDRTRESWFKFRAELYRQTLGRSLSAQTERPSCIYLLMDAGDRSLCEKYLQGLEFVPIYVGGMHERSVAEDLEAKGIVDNVALTRIDSDDIVAKNYLEKLNKKIRETMTPGGDGGLVITCAGYRTNFVQVQSAFHCAPPFITLFRTRYRGENVYSHDHREITEKPHVKDTDAEWMQVIHGTNVSNGFKPSNTHSLDIFKAGDKGSGFTELRPMDTDWFREWAGFELPSPDLFAQAPVMSPWSRVRKMWRAMKGKI